MEMSTSKFKFGKWFLGIRKNAAALCHALSARPAQVSKHPDRQPRQHQGNLRGRDEEARLRLRGALRPAPLLLRRAHQRAGLLHDGQRGGGAQEAGRPR